MAVLKQTFRDVGLESITEFLPRLLEAPHLLIPQPAHLPALQAARVLDQRDVRAAGDPQRLTSRGAFPGDAMPELRSLKGTGVHIFRPLLAHSRAALKAHAQDEGLRWIDDESNATTGPDRNFLRHDVAPLFDVRYPGWREALARFARHAGAAGDLLDALATVDGVPTQPGASLPLNAALSTERRANALRAFLARNAVAMPLTVSISPT